MPKLDKAKAKATGEAESTFGPLDEGVYLGTLAEVTSGNEGPKGEYWIWRFEDLINVDTDEKAPGNLWLNTSLSADAAWKMKEVFDAFGVKPDTDTDTLLGEQVQLAVEQRVIEKGPRKGSLGNDIVQVLAVGADPNS